VIGTGPKLAVLPACRYGVEAFCVHLRAEGNNPYSILKDLNSYETSWHGVTTLSRNR
jgi:hypothetical protein